ncbi:hypothetical protein H8959_003793 [Pygathrix nigripes]
MQTRCYRASPRKLLSMGLKTPMSGILYKVSHSNPTSCRQNDYRMLEIADTTKALSSGFVVVVVVGWTQDNLAPPSGLLAASRSGAGGPRTARGGEQRGGGGRAGLFSAFLVDASERAGSHPSPPARQGQSRGSWLPAGPQGRRGAAPGPDRDAEEPVSAAGGTVPAKVTSAAVTPRPRHSPNAACREPESAAQPARRGTAAVAGALQPP